MKDILITIISVLLTVLIIVCMVRGISVGQFQILSIAEIKTNSLALDSEIENLNNLKNVTYKKKLNDLQTSIKNLTKSKQDYLDLASISTDSEIQQANLEQSYAMEFLWNKVGTYATQEGLGLTWNVVSTGVTSKYTLNFTISGSYIGIINYVYALENDAELAFRIENFKISGGGGTTTTTGGNSSTSAQGDYRVTATFTVSNIGIKEESITSSKGNNTNTNANDKINNRTNKDESSKEQNNKNNSNNTNTTNE